MLIEDIRAEYGLESHFAGRSGGWIEVDFENNLNVDELEDMNTKEVHAEYKEARELEKLEARVEAFITKQHDGYNKYVDSKEYYENITDTLSDDDTIKREYKERADDLLAKIENNE